MTEIARIDLRALAPKPKPIQEEVFVGKDILELLAGAMYADPLTIYREYIQNSADAIDVARGQGELPEGGGEIQIRIDPQERVIRIRDDGASLPSAVFTRTLTSIGASGKRGKLLRGFRGVGRLSGLGYCQELIFRGRATGESKVMELRWDGRQLRNLLRDPGFNGDLSSLVQGIATVTHLDGAAFPARFFEVELQKVARLRSDVLLDEDQVRHYVSQVCPVPFSPTFSFGPRIAKLLKERGIPDPVRILVGSDETPVYHRAREELVFGRSVTDRVAGFEPIELRGMDGDVAAFGWILDHGYLGALPRKEGMGGIRLRSGNIQVGAMELASGLFAEPRLASWAIGDIHVISPKIVPNGRRDDFEPTLHYAHLQDEVALIGKTISHVIRTQSDHRNRLRRIKSELAVATEWFSRLDEERYAAELRERVAGIIAGRLNEAAKHLGKLPTTSKEYQEAETSLASLRRRVAKLEKGAKDSTEKSLTRPTRIALDIMLANAASPHAALGMSKKLIQALESAGAGGAGRSPKR